MSTRSARPGRDRPLVAPSLRGQQSPAPDPAFALSVTRTKGAVVVTACGRLDSAGGAVLDAVLVDLIEGQGNLRVIVDVHDMTVDDPLNLAVLVAAATSADRQGAALILADPGDSLFVQLEAIGLTRAVTVAGHRRRCSSAPPPGASGRGPRHAGRTPNIEPGPASGRTDPARPPP